ncbi:MAG: TetR family transcriptional regulator [Leptolyngbyaceae bacterium]|nr:TetR family transcriptional regulator [Leptolyngbyaceae bacterium]
MSSSGLSTRQRLIRAALELFASQGVTETTTRQIAELAEVNEVTLFRQFGNKHGLLLAVIEDSTIFNHLGESLVQQANEATSVYQALKDYANGRLQALEQVPEFIRSLVGEAGQYPTENRQALGRGMTQANQYVAQYLETVICRGQLQTHFPPEKLASLLNGMLLGYVVIEFTSEFHKLWDDRDDFVENLIDLFLNGAVSGAAQSDPNFSRVFTTAPALSTSGSADIVDLPATLVHTMLQRAKKLGVRDYALMYLLFASGLGVGEIVMLERSHQISDANQHLLHVAQGSTRRRVPVNRRILGKSYGSYTNNPLTQWLKSRKDEQSALLLNDAGQPIAEAEIQACWKTCVEGLATPEGQLPAIEQAQQTWCIEMLVRGIDLEDLSILTGWDIATLKPYARRAKEKLALEQAIKLDQ